MNRNIRFALFSQRLFETLLILVWSLVLSVSCADLPPAVLEEVNKPAAKEFQLGPEDVLEVAVWRNQDLSRVVTIRPDGMISLPLIGDVPAAGSTAAEVGDRIAKRLTEFKENPAVSVSVKEVNSYYIYVVGEVAKPGKYPLKSHATVLQGVSLAGGFTPFASRNNMAVIRNTRAGKSESRQLRIPVPYDALVKGKSEVGNFILMAGDTIVVP
jgi:polysaccharide export outer membrane protein